MPINLYGFRPAHISGIGWRLFDFIIPIPAFDQTNGDLTVVPFCQLIKVVNDTLGTGSIGLNNNAKPFTFCKVWIEQNCPDECQWQRQRIGLFVSVLNPSGVAFAASAKVFKRGTNSAITRSVWASS